MSKILRNNNIYNKEAGFTLIEIIVSIAILSIIIIATSRYYVKSIQFVHRTEIRSQALLIARITIEEMKAEAVDNWDILDDIVSNFNVDDSVFSSLDLLSNYTINITLNQPDIDGDGSNDTNLQEIVVNVSWGTDEVELQSLIAKR